MDEYEVEVVAAFAAADTDRAPKLHTRRARLLAESPADAERDALATLLAAEHKCEGWKAVLVVAFADRVAAARQAA